MQLFITKFQWLAHTLMLRMLLGRVGRLKFGRFTVIAVPYVWLIVFFVVPFVILLRLSFTDLGQGANPFVPLTTITDGVLTLSLKYQNYIDIFFDDQTAEQTIYLRAYLLSFKYAALTTLLCLLVGYPFAYCIAIAREVYRPALLMLVMLPFWVSFLLRIYAWKGILADQGVINNILIALGVIQEPITMLYTDISMLVGMTYVYLPFMVLPLYATLVKMDFRLLEAAGDLGASPFKAFWLITVPLSYGGIVAGAMLVFIPCLGEFVIPSLLGGAENLMIGRVVWDEMFSNNNWPRAAALAVTMLLLVIIPFAIYQRYSRVR